MAYAYLFALIVGVGILTVQALFGGKDADADHDLDGDADHDLELEGDGDADADADADAVDDHDHAADGFGPGDLVALFLSVRFWVFASVGFGLSGTLLTWFTGVSAVATAISAVSLGLVSGLFAALAFRALKQSASSAAENTTEVAIGQIGRVLLPLPETGRGKIRIQISGQAVDMVAKSGGARIERGDAVIVEEVEDGTAVVSRAPKELQ